VCARVVTCARGSALAPLGRTSRSLVAHAGGGPRRVQMPDWAAPRNARASKARSLQKYDLRRGWVTSRYGGPAWC